MAVICIDVCQGQFVNHRVERPSHYVIIAFHNAPNSIAKRHKIPELRLPFEAIECLAVLSDRDTSRGKNATSRTDSIGNFAQVKDDQSCETEEGRRSHNKVCVDSQISG